MSHAQADPLPDPRRSFADASRVLLARPGLGDAVRSATGHTIVGLAKLAAEEPRWEALKDHAAAIKRHTLTHLDRYLEQFILAVESRGGHVHFAADAAEGARIVCDIARAAGSKRCVKAKSMVSEELDLGDALEAAGVEPIETDVGELIVQLGHDRPSHIIAPAIHLDVDAVEAIYRRAGLATAPPPPAPPPQGFLERATFMSLEARRHLREPFLTADLGISGANMLIADRGGVLLVENEGNIRLTTTLPRTHIVMAGPEKLVPSLTDAGVLLSLLAPSATGQRQSSYVSVIEGPLREDRQLHVVLIDAGRLGLLADPELFDTLACIRCGACMNHCPVYRQVGGHAYGHEVPGPIGKILLPHLRRSRVASELPFASSLCGACAEVCPVRIPIPRYLIALRARLAPGGWKAFAFRRWAKAMSSPAAYRRFTRLARMALGARKLVSWLPPLRAWTRHRELPERPPATFRDWWEERSR